MRLHPAAGPALALLLAATAAPALAQKGPPAIPGKPDPAAVKAGTYAVEPAHTQVGFSVNHLGLTRYDGVFSNASGELTIDPRSLAASRLDVTVPVASVRTTSDKLDGELKSDQWLDAGRYPTMRFRSTRVVRTGPATANVEGELTLHGVTGPLVLKARFIGAGFNFLDKSETVGFEASGVLKRSDFGVKTYLPLIGDETTLSINAAFNRRP